MRFILIATSNSLSLSLFLSLSDHDLGIIQGLLRLLMIVLMAISNSISHTCFLFLSLNAVNLFVYSV